MKSKSQLFNFGIFFLSLFTIASCMKDDDDMMDPGNEQEVITTVQVTFSPTDGSTPITFVYEDQDGPGGQNAVADAIVLAANTTYEISVDFLDNSNPSSAVFLTDEVQEEAEEHLVCYAVGGAVPEVTIKDQDADGEPLGLIAEVETGAAGSGTLTVSLKHEPMKSNANPCNTGESDVEAPFSVTIN